MMRFTSAREFIDFYDYLTPTLKTLIAHFESNVPPEAFQQFLRDIEVLLEEGRLALLSVAPGALRAEVLHQLLEREIEKAAAIPVSCKKGCSACCHMEVEINADEAALLVDVIEAGVAVDMELLESQSRRKTQDSSWMLGVTASNRCVFLSGEGSCSIYSNRPSSCRKHAVVSPAEHCQSRKENPVPRNIPLAEIVLSSAGDIAEGQMGSLPTMIMREIRRRRLERSELTSY
jgi:Fe-S-cluster containining protein